MIWFLIKTKSLQVNDALKQYQTYPKLFFFVSNIFLETSLTLILIKYLLRWDVSI